jgi:hypothetical protein
VRSVRWRMASSCPVIDDFAKDYLHGKLGPIRQALVWTLDGLSEYDAVRDPDLVEARP